MRTEAIICFCNEECFSHPYRLQSFLPNSETVLDATILTEKIMNYTDYVNGSLISGRDP